MSQNKMFYRTGPQDEYPRIFTWADMLRAPKYSKFKVLGQEHRQEMWVNLGQDHNGAPALLYLNAFSGQVSVITAPPTSTVEKFVETRDEILTIF